MYEAHFFMLWYPFLKFYFSCHSFCYNYYKYHNDNDDDDYYYYGDDANEM